MLSSLKFYFARAIWCQVSLFSLPCPAPPGFYLRTRKSHFASRLWTVTTKCWRLVQSSELLRLEYVSLAEGIPYSLWAEGGCSSEGGCWGQLCYPRRGRWAVLTAWGCVSGGARLWEVLCGAGRGVSFIFHAEAAMERTGQDPLPLSLLPLPELSCKKEESPLVLLYWAQKSKEALRSFHDQHSNPDSDLLPLVSSPAPFPCPSVFTLWRTQQLTLPKHMPCGGLFLKDFA